MRGLGLVLLMVLGFVRLGRLVGVANRIILSMGIFITFILILSGCASSAHIKAVESKQPISIKPDQKSKPIQFKKIVVKLQRGEDIGAIQTGLLCAAQADLVWKGGKLEVTGDDFTDVFRDELEKANYTVVGNPDALFDDPSDWKAELLVAGLITEMQANICYPWGGFGNWTTGKGEAFLKVNWQIYSRLDRKVIYETITEGSNKVGDSSPTGPTDVVLNAFSLATQNLLADEGFNGLVAGIMVAEKTPTQRKLFIAKAGLYQTPIDEHINDVRSGVVTIFAGDGHGSGFFISPDGYVLTNAHVVGGAKFVKIKLATNREILGEVSRLDNRRDLALIKTEESQMEALPLNLNQPNVGEDVYAIGTPLDESLSTTLSKGVVSNYHIEDAQRYIQSDVNVLPGSSGGPLLDSNGNVVGITSNAIFLGQSTTGLNFFIPINEAFSSLSIQ